MRRTVKGKKIIKRTSAETGTVTAIRFNEKSCQMSQHIKKFYTLLI